MKKVLAGLVAVTCLTGCATVLEGTDQWISVVVNPPDATCQAMRKGELLDSTLPGKPRLHVTKSRNDLEVTCTAAGFKTQTVRVESSVSAAGVGSVLAWDLGVTDYATGALNKYPDTVVVNLEPVK